MESRNLSIQRIRKQMLQRQITKKKKNCPKGPNAKSLFTLNASELVSFAEMKKMPQ